MTAQFRRSREIYEFLGQADTVSYANVLRNLANTLGMLREIDEAIELSRRAIDIYTASLAPDHNLLGVAFNDLGIIYRSDGQYDEAEQWLRRSLEIRGRQLPANPVVYATILENLAGVLQWQDRDDEAEGMFRESLTIHRDQLSPDHLSVGRAANNLGFFLLLQDRHSEARQILGDTVGESDARYANAVDRLGEHELAQPLYDEALAVRAWSQGTDHFEYAATAAMAALTEFALGNTEEAQRLAGSAGRAYVGNAWLIVTTDSGQSAPSRGVPDGTGATRRRRHSTRRMGQIPTRIWCCTMSAGERGCPSLSLPSRSFPRSSLSSGETTIKCLQMPRTSG